MNKFNEMTMTSISDIISDYRVLSLAKWLESTGNLNERAFFDAIEHIVPPLPSASTVEMLLADWKTLRSSLLGKIDGMSSRYRPRVDCIVEVTPRCGARSQVRNEGGRS